MYNFYSGSANNFNCRVRKIKIINIRGPREKMNKHSKQQEVTKNSRFL